MLNNQLWLWPDMGEIEPYPKRHFPTEAVPALELLFYIGVATPRTGPACPYRVGMNVVSGLSCDCQSALTLVHSLGRNQPVCSTHRCPVRQILAETEAR